MRFHLPAALCLALCASSALIPTVRADSLVTTGIGLANCAKLRADLTPGQGFDQIPNALLFYWVQGYISAANIYLLNEYTDYVDRQFRRGTRDHQVNRGFLRGQSGEEADQRDGQIHPQCPRTFRRRNPIPLIPGSTEHSWWQKIAVRFRPKSQ